jgi:hypothetical protein
MGRGIQSFDGAPNVLGSSSELARSLFYYRYTSTKMLFQGQTMNPALSPLLAYPTELLRHAYSQPLIPNTSLPFNLLFTMNAIRLNLEYTKSQRGVERGYLQVPRFFKPLTYRVC